jgi:ATP-dependent DNA helicase RecG
MPQERVPPRSRSAHQLWESLLGWFSAPRFATWVDGDCDVRGDVEPGKDVAVVRATRGYSVHSVWHNSGNTYYIRVGTQSREATPEELSRLFQQRGAFRAELRPVSGARLADLDRRRLLDYFGRVRQQDAPDEGDESGWSTLLLNTELMVEDGVTVAGLLPFGTQSNRFLPSAGIDAVAFSGIEKDYAARERATLRGPMTPLIGEGGLVENGPVEQALDFIRRNIASKTTLANGARREEVPVYPAEVLRETVENALIHRRSIVALLAYKSTALYCTIMA